MFFNFSCECTQKFVCIIFFIRLNRHRRFCTYVIYAILVRSFPFVFLSLLLSKQRILQNLNPTLAKKQGPTRTILLIFSRLYYVTLKIRQCAEVFFLTLKTKNRMKVSCVHGPYAYGVCCLTRANFVNALCNFSKLGVLITFYYLP